MKKNLLLVLFIILLLFIKPIFEKYNSDDNEKNDFLKNKKQQQEEIVNGLKEFITYNLNCPAKDETVFACNRNYDSIKKDNYSYCSDSVISKYICDMSNNSYTNLKFILSKFNMNDENEKRKINNLMNNCSLGDKSKCIDDTKKCISKLLICILDKTYFARHRSLDEFKVVYRRTFKDCISSIEVLSNKYALNCNI